jgi:oxygen-independent coproporphyrinogen-3 oxidase
MTDRLSAPGAVGTPAAIYVHVPFCRHICPYCDFNTYSGQEAKIGPYVDGLIEEIQLVTSRHPPAGPAPSLFFGGGTPSLLPARAISRLIDVCANTVGLTADAEITLEANPESADAAHLREIRLAGVNRLSLGVQTWRQAGLRVLGRNHHAEQALAAYRAARQAGFDNVSLDFIYGWPGQSREDWQADLQVILDLQPEHVSLYSLIVEPNTPFETAVRQGILTPADDDTTADLFERAVDTMAGAGWEHYEISNWACEPRYRSRHNQVYWRNGEYYGFGAGAHSHLSGTRASNVRLPAAYLETVAAGRRPLAMAEEISPETAMAETMMLGLRLLVDGVSASAFEARHGRPLYGVYEAPIERFRRLGLLDWDGERARLTKAGTFVANDILVEFLPD